MKETISAKSGDKFMGSRKATRLAVWEGIVGPQLLVSIRDPVRTSCARRKSKRGRIYIAFLETQFQNQTKIRRGLRHRTEDLIHQHYMMPWFQLWQQGIA
jgi:hypothetical protein